MPEVRLSYRLWFIKIHCMSIECMPQTCTLRTEACSVPVVGTEDHIGFSILCTGVCIHVH